MQISNFFNLKSFFSTSEIDPEQISGSDNIRRALVDAMRNQVADCPPYVTQDCPYPHGYSGDQLVDHLDLYLEYDTSYLKYPISAEEVPPGRNVNILNWDKLMSISYICDTFRELPSGKIVNLLARYILSKKLSIVVVAEELDRSMCGYGSNLLACDAVKQMTAEEIERESPKDISGLVQTCFEEYSFGMKGLSFGKYHYTLMSLFDSPLASKVDHGMICTLLPSLEAETSKYCYPDGIYGFEPGAEEVKRLRDFGYLKNLFLAISNLPCYLGTVQKKQLQDLANDEKSLTHFVHTLKDIGNALNTIALMLSFEESEPLSEDQKKQIEQKKDEILKDLPFTFTMPKFLREGSEDVEVKFQAIKV